MIFYSAFTLILVIFGNLIGQTPLQSFQVRETETESNRKRKITKR